MPGQSLVPTRRQRCTTFSAATNGHGWAASGWAAPEMMRVCATEELRMALALFDRRPGEQIIPPTHRRGEPCCKTLCTREAKSRRLNCRRGRLKPDFRLLGPVVGFCIA